MKIITCLIVVSSCFAWSGCIGFGPHIINATDDPAWWGQLAKGEVLQAKQDARLYSGWLLLKGTRLRCVKLERFFSSEDRRYEVSVEIVDGELKGKVANLGSFVYGDPNVKGSLGYYTNYFEPVQ